MLKRFRIVGLCLVAVFAVSAVGAANASALAFFHVKCVFVGTNNGQFSTGECNKKEAPFAYALAATELAAGEKVTFISSSGEGHMKTTIGEVKCTADSGSGETNGPTAVAAVVTK